MLVLTIPVRTPMASSLEARTVVGTCSGCTPTTQFHWTIATGCVSQGLRVRGGHQAPPNPVIASICTMVMAQERRKTRLGIPFSRRSLDNLRAQPTERGGHARSSCGNGYRWQSAFAYDDGRISLCATASRAGVAQSVEHLLPKQRVASSSLVSRSISPIEGASTPPILRWLSLPNEAHGDRRSESVACVADPFR